MKTRFLLIAACCGILTPIFTLTLIFISVAMSPWFSWHDNALSDMGVSPSPNPFNPALIMGGLLYFVFVIGFIRWNRPKTRLFELGAIAMVLGATGLTLIGILTEDAGRIHYFVAATYFLATPLAYVLFGTDMIRRSDRLPGVLTLAAGVAAFLAIAAVPHKALAVPEILAAIIMSVWTFSMGVKMLVEPAPQPEQR